MSGIFRLYHAWAESDAQDNSLATATRAAPKEGISHYITGVSGSYDATADGSLVLKDGSTTVATWHVYDVFSMVFPHPIKLSPGTAANLELAASGTAGTTGNVVLVGYTL